MKGQVLVILLLIILVTLTVGLAVIQTSITDVSTSTKTEQSSRAFSAAEAALERALLTAGPVSSLPPLMNNASAKVDVISDLPIAGQALEYPPISKADFAHFWLKDPADIINQTTDDYTYGSFIFYFGSCDPTPCWQGSQPKPAVEVNVVVKNASGVYSTWRRFYDAAPLSRSPSNNFTDVSLGCDPNGVTAPGGTTSSLNSKFYCQVTVTGYKPIGTEISQVVRVRVLYANKAQKVAVGPHSLASPNRLPPQADIYTSIGTASDTVRQIKVFREKYVVPLYFDYAIFSVGAINK